MYTYFVYKVINNFIFNTNILITYLIYTFNHFLFLLNILYLSGLSFSKL